MTKTIRTILRKYGVRIVVVFLSMLFLCAYVNKKEGFHMDEILAFQLANAEYNPWIVPTQPVGRLAKFMDEYIDGESIGETISNVGFIVKDTLTNRGGSILANYKADVYEAPVWISGKMFRDYVRCESYDDYNLISVYFNVKDDNHPPLHFMLLHIMTSVFKGEISVWHGAVINLAAIAGTLWLLGLIGDMVFKNRKSSVALMVLYGFSMGAVASAIWIRMYALLTLWTVWGLYLHIRKYTCRSQDSFLRINPKNGKVKWLGSISIFVVTVLSFWTQYFGLFFILPLALVTVILLAKERRIPEVWAYIRTMVTAAVVGIGVFPFAIGDVLFSDRGTEALSQWKNGFSEYAERIKVFGSILAENVAADTLAFFIAVIVPVGFILYKYVRKRMNESCFGEAIWMTFIPTLVYFLLAAKMSPYFIDRYIMAIFPVTALLVMWLWDVYCYIWVSSENRGQFLGRTAEMGCVLLAIVLSCMQLVQMGGEHTYLYPGYEAQVQVAKDYSRYPAVCLYDGYNFYENVVEMEYYEQSILLKKDQLSAMDEGRIQVAENGYIALIKHPGEEGGKEQLEQMMHVFGGSTAEVLYEGGAFGDIVYLVTP